MTAKQKTPEVSTALTPDPAVAELARRVQEMTHELIAAEQRASVAERQYDEHVAQVAELETENERLLKIITQIAEMSRWTHGDQAIQLARDTLRNDSGDSIPVRGSARVKRRVSAAAQRTLRPAGATDQSEAK